jgi:UDP-galactopyranose mutase
VHTGTSIVREYPQAEGDPYYPVPRPENEFLFKRYEALAQKESGVTFVGRLAQYRYYNMDQCVGAALKAAQYVLEAIGLPERPLSAVAARSHAANLATGHSLTK